MRVYAIPTVSEQVDKIREAIRENGIFIAGCEELSILCPEVSEADRMVGIEQIAQWEGWLVEPLPDQTVRFRSLLRRAA